MATVYPNLQFTRVTQGATMATTSFRQIQTAIVQIEQDMINAKGGVSTLATFLNRMLSASGEISGGSHGALVNVTVNQHHGQLHHTAHRTTDAAWASAGRGGLMAASFVVIVQQAHSQATYNPRVPPVGHIGDGGVRFFNIGFRPGLVIFKQDATASPANFGYQSEWHTLDGATYAILHRATLAVANTKHLRPKATLSLRVTALGFVVGGDLNISGRRYTYFALKGDD